MIQFTPLRTHHPQYSFVEELLHASFPAEERRDDEAQRYNTDHHPRFTCYLITDGESDVSTPIGFITVWHLGRFYYGEHLATSPSVRNRGYGRQIMQRLPTLCPGTFVLEVEEPTDEMSRRRIGFYQRCGFSLCERAYVQPPYRPTDKGLPLKLMYAGTDSIDTCFEEIRDEIYREVYGYVVD